jgi:hemolysin III
MHVCDVLYEVVRSMDERIREDARHDASWCCTRRPPCTTRSARRAPSGVFRRLDHSAIYLLIAGTYTPFTLVTLRGALGWTLFATIWTMALFGIVRAWRSRGDEDPSVWPYVVMGWLAVVAAVPLVTQLGGEGIAWLAAGSGLYMAGIVFYVNDTRWRHAHGIWHLFVLGGSTAHFVTVLRFVG